MDRRAFLSFIPAVGAIALLPTEAKGEGLVGEVQLVQTFDRGLAPSELQAAYDRLKATRVRWRVTSLTRTTIACEALTDLDASDYNVVTYTVDCPYPATSTDWISVSDHYDGKTEPRWSCPDCGETNRGMGGCISTDFLFGPDEPEAAEAARVKRHAEHERRNKRRRIQFPHIEGDGEGVIVLDDLGTTGTISDRIRSTHAAVAKHGFDNKPGDQYPIMGHSPWKVCVVRFDCSDGGTRWIVAGLPRMWDDALVLGKMEMGRIA